VSLAAPLAADAADASLDLNEPVVEDGAHALIDVRLQLHVGRRNHARRLPPCGVKPRRRRPPGVNVIPQHPLETFADASLGAESRGAAEHFRSKLAGEPRLDGGG
jgi:hypothetical protein